MRLGIGFGLGPFRISQTLFRTGGRRRRSRRGGVSVPADLGAFQLIGAAGRYAGQKIDAAHAKQLEQAKSNGMVKEDAKRIKLADHFAHDMHRATMNSALMWFTFTLVAAVATPSSLLLTIPAGIYILMVRQRVAREIKQREARALINRCDRDWEEENRPRGRHAA